MGCEGPSTRTFATASSTSFATTGLTPKTTSATDARNRTRISRVGNPLIGVALKRLDGSNGPRTSPEAPKMYSRLNDSCNTNPDHINGFTKNTSFEIERVERARSTITAAIGLARLPSASTQNFFVWKGMLDIYPYRHIMSTCHEPPRPLTSSTRSLNRVGVRLSLSWPTVIAWAVGELVDAMKLPQPAVSEVSGRPARCRRRLRTTSGKKPTLFAESYGAKNRARLDQAIRTTLGWPA